jgi:hypothetical protein
MRSSFTVALVGALVSLVTACGPDKGVYVAANEAILGQMPSLPGAKEISRETTPYYLREARPVSGYGTRVTYLAPPSLTGDEMGAFFFREAGAEWRRHVEETPSISLETGKQLDPMRHYQLCRGNAVVAIDTSNVPLNRTFDVFVDYNFGGDGKRIMPCP